MKIAQAILVGTTATLVAGCATGFQPTIVSAGDSGVTYRIPANQIDETRRTAQEYCNDRGRTARLQSVSPAGGDRSIAVFTCV